MSEPTITEALHAADAPEIVQMVQSTLDDRGVNYGDYTDVSASSQRLKDAARQAPGWHKLTHDQAESVEMILHKIARIISGGNPSFVDNWHDIGGYALLSEQRCSPPIDNA